MDSKKRKHNKEVFENYLETNAAMNKYARQICNRLPDTVLARPFRILCLNKTEHVNIECENMADASISTLTIPMDIFLDGPIACEKHLNKAAKQPAEGHIIRSPRGLNRRTVKIADIKIPDLWHVAMTFSENSETRKEIIETWELCHDMLDNLKGMVGDV